MEKNDPGDDLLDVRDAAERFAERVLNGGSSETLIFGVDAPWGAGKSSFINFCTADWQKHKNIIIYRFNPLQYEDRTHLLNKFVDGLTLTVKQAVFKPELGTIVSRYSNLISAKKNIKFLGFDIDLMPPSLTVEDAAESVKYALSKLDHRVVIIVDDLDRMAFSALKDILFVIKKGFFLPNISFILCYDTQNIATLEGSSYDSEKISEFLEKFVNVKISLYPSSADLKRFITENLKVALGKNIQADPRILDEVLGGLRELYDSGNYERFLPAIGDVRKIKRIINTLLMLNIEKTDFRNLDILHHDLIILIIIYINFPALFRKIYNCETHGRYGYFSAVINTDRSGVRYTNSEKFRTFIKELEDSKKFTERFLIEQIFDVTNRVGGNDNSRLPEADRRSLACFNSDAVGGRNLEPYLNLIVRVTQPQQIDQYRFYANAKDQFKDGTPLEAIFQAPEFSFSRKETSHEQFWRVISSSVDEFNKNQMDTLIRYITHNITQYSILESNELGVGLRNSSLIYILLKLIDQGGWRDESGRRINNSSQNIEEIAQWTLGLSAHAGEGIIEVLTAPDRGPIGWNDALAFRLNASADRSNSLFNISNALALHGDPAAPTSGSVSDIAVAEMRELSQLIFRIFKERYIDAKRNFLQDVNDITVSELLGKFEAHVASEISANNISHDAVNTLAESSRETIKAFSIYQLTNREINSGVGCGYYDEFGSNDTGGIHTAMNDYLFGICFAKNKNNDGHFYFIQYLMICFRRSFDSVDARLYKPFAFPSVLDPSLLKSYWLKNRKTILARKFEESDLKVVTPNYEMKFHEGVPQILEMLDQESASPPP